MYDKKLEKIFNLRAKLFCQDNVWLEINLVRMGLEKVLNYIYVRAIKE